MQKEKSEREGVKTERRRNNQGLDYGKKPGEKPRQLSGTTLSNKSTIKNWKKMGEKKRKIKGGQKKGERTQGLSGRGGGLCKGCKKKKGTGRGGAQGEKTVVGRQIPM